MRKDRLYKILEQEFGSLPELKKMTDDIWNIGMYECARPFFRVVVHLEIRQESAKEMADPLQKDRKLDFDPFARLIPVSQSENADDEGDDVAEDDPYFGGSARWLERLGLVRGEGDGAERRYALTKKGNAFMAGKGTIPVEIVIFAVQGNDPRGPAGSLKYLR